MTDKELNNNVKTFPLYRALSFDFMFFHVISLLYLTQIKHFSYSQAIFLDAIYMLSIFILQIPTTKLIKHIGRSMSTRLACIAWLGFIAIYIWGMHFPMFILAHVLFGFGVAVRNITDVEILSISLKKLNKKNHYSKVEGKGMFYYYIFEGISSIIAGYLYEFVSPYAPLICSAVCICLAFALTFVMKDPKTDDSVEEIQDLNSVEEPTIKTLLKRPFVIAMIMFCFCMFGLCSVQLSMAKIYYQNIHTPAYLFGYIFCALKFVSALSAKYQFKYELKSGVRGLIILAIIMVISYTVNAITYYINPQLIISIIVITTMFILQQIAKPAYRIYAKNYINVCSSKKGLTKTLTLYSMAESLGYAFTTLYASLMMHISNNNFPVSNLALSSLYIIPTSIACFLFVRAIIKAYTSRCTIFRNKDDI